MYSHLQKKAEDAQRVYEEGERQLFRLDGSKLYSEDEHRDRVRALAQERTRKIDLVLEELRGEVETARKDLSVLEDGDVTDLLSGFDLAEAQAKREFVADDVFALSKDKLVDRLRAVLAGGDRASIFTYWRAASARYDSLSGEHGVGAQDLAEVLEEMSVFLAGPERLAKAQNAREKMGAAWEVELSVSNLKSGARSSAERWIQNQRVNRQYGRAG